jgi:hypothetical protein
MTTRPVTAKDREAEPVTPDPKLFESPDEPFIGPSIADQLAQLERRRSALAVHIAELEAYRKQLTGEASAAGPS